MPAAGARNARWRPGAQRSRSRADRDKAEHLDNDAHYTVSLSDPNAKLVFDWSEEGTPIHIHY